MGTSRNGSAAGDSSEGTTTQWWSTPEPTPKRALVSVYLPKALFDAARAAYISDFEHGSGIETWIGWVSQAVRNHAALTTERRAQMAPDRPARAAEAGVSRSLRIEDDAARSLRGAVSDDHTQGRYVSESAWVVEALVAAVETSRQTAGGTLPDPPARLPQRLGGKR